MSPSVLVAAAILALTVGACAKLDTFDCAVSSECVHEGVAGVCEQDGLCSFPDASCPSGKKYGEFAGSQSGQCVDLVGASTGPVSATQSTAPTSDGGEATTTNEPSQVSATTSDPTTLTTTTDPSTTSDETTGGPACVGLGEACDGVPCCSPCMTCSAGVCQAAPAEAGPAACGGLCFTCGADGECAPMLPDTLCTSDCNLVIWQSQVVGAKTACYSYADLPTASTCDAAGQCRLPAASDCPDPTLQPGSEKLLAQCDSVCLVDAALCTPGGPAAAVTMNSFCVVNGESAGCADACTLDMNMAPAQDDATCDGTGTCMHTLTSCSGGLKCDPVDQQCFDKCNKDDQCVSEMCMGTTCQ